MTVIIKNKRIVTDRLIPFGFVQSGDTYTYTTDIMDGQFSMILTVTADGVLTSRVVDTASDEEYVLHLMEDATGSFVGSVREAYQAVIDRMIAMCCEDDIFRSPCTKRLIEHIRERYGDEPEFLWPRYPDCCIWRREDNRKWYAALMKVSRRKLGLNADEEIEILDLRMAPADVVNRVDGATIFPGWHMNKKSWITVLLDGSADFDFIVGLLDDSYALAKGKK